MADELTPDQRRELDAIDRALSGRAVDPDLDGIAALTNELREARATPRPEFAAQLDECAAGWLAGGRQRRRGLPWLRIAVPAAATAAAVVVAVAISGGGDGGDESRLRLSAVPEEQRSGALAAPESAPKAQDDAGADAPESRGLELESSRVASGAPLVVRYEIFRTAKAEVHFAGRSGELTLEPGSGRLEIGTEGVVEGEWPLSVALETGGALRTTVSVTP